MRKTNKTRYVILGMLFDEPQTGYQIREFIERSTAHFWQESDASIYPTLKLLAKEGKISSRTEFVGKRKKEVFKITAKGRKEFDEWFKRPPEPDSIRHEFLLKLFFTTKETQGEMKKHFERRLRDLQGEFEELKGIEAKLESEFRKHPRQPFWLKTLRHGIAHLELEMNWLREGF